MPDAQIELPPEADVFVNRVRKVEGTAGDPHVLYGNTPYKPGKEHPADTGWSGVRTKEGTDTHAADMGQWQPGTWHEVRDRFKGYGVDLDFSNQEHQKAAIWDQGYKRYKELTGGRDLRQDIKDNKVEWAKLAPEWQGFKPRTVETDKPGGKIDPQAIAYGQSRPHQSVWYLDPQELLESLPPIEKDVANTSKRKSLMKSLFQKGEDIYDLPEIEVTDKGDKRKIVSFDGRNRLQMMIDAGLTAVPVVVKNLEPGVRPDAIEGMTGKIMPMRFDPVPITPLAPKPSTPSERFYSGARSVLEGAESLINRSLPAMTEAGRAGMERADLRDAQRIEELKRTGGTAWPYAAGEIAASLPAGAIAAPAGAGLAARVGVGAVAGGVVGAAQPVEDPARYWAEKAEQIGLGALGGAVGTPIAEGIAKGIGAIAGPIARSVGSAVTRAEDAAGPALQPAVNAIKNWLGGTAGVRDVENPAAKAVLQRIQSDVRGGGPTAQDMLDVVRSAPTKPLTLMDVAGENVRGLAGRVARQPGPAREQLKRFLDERDRQAGSRIAGDVGKAISPGGSAYSAKEALMRARSAAARPLYEKAFEGGSMAPLESHFENAFNEAGRAEQAAQQRLNQVRDAVTQAFAKQSTAQNVYSASAANRAVRYAQDRIGDAERALKSARVQKDAIRERLRGAQEDRTANAPGAVWSPRLQQFLDEPEVQRGIRRGWKLQRLEDLADGKPFNPHEYAVVGTEKNGDPIVGKVPNMRLLDAGKKGLDAIVTQHTDPVTGRMDETAKVFNDVRRAYVGELDRLNTDYKAARDAWAGPSRSTDAINKGRRVLTTNPQQIAADMARLSPSNREFYKLGAADILIERLAKKGASADEAKLIIGNEWTKSQLRPLFENQADYDRFITGVEAEARMFKTGYDILGNSRTAARQAEDFSPMADVAAHAGHAALNVAHHHYVGAAANALRGIAAMRRKTDPILNQGIADILTAPLGQGSAGMKLLSDFSAIGPKTRNMLAPVATRGNPYVGPVAGVAANNLGQ